MNVSATPSSVVTGRLKWHSRRALLELDIVLDRYWQRLGETEPAPEQKQILSEMLLLEDHDLWDMLCGRQELGDARWSDMVDTLMQTAQTAQTAQTGR